MSAFVAVVTLHIAFLPLLSVGIEGFIMGLVLWIACNSPVVFFEDDLLGYGWGEVYCSKTSAAVNGSARMHIRRWKRREKCGCKVIVVHGLADSSQLVSKVCKLLKMGAYIVFFTTFLGSKPSHQVDSGHEGTVLIVLLKGIPYPLCSTSFADAVKDVIRNACTKDGLNMTFPLPPTCLGCQPTNIPFVDVLLGGCILGQVDVQPVSVEGVDEPISINDPVGAICA
jgi:hypothetical protein